MPSGGSVAVQRDGRYAKGGKWARGWWLTPYRHAGSSAVQRAFSIDAKLRHYYATVPACPISVMDEGRTTDDDQGSAAEFS